MMNTNGNGPPPPPQNYGQAQQVYHGQDPAYPPADPAYPPPVPPTYQGPPPQVPTYQGPPPPYQQQLQQQLFQQIISTQPTRPAAPDGTIPKFELLPRGEPADMQCPHCRERIETLINYKIGCNAVLAFFICLLIGFFFFGCIIACMGHGTKDVIHSCPRCYEEVGRDKRICGRTDSNRH